MAVSGGASIHVAAPAGVVFDVITDVARYPEWAKGVRSCEVLERDADGRALRAQFSFDGMIRSIECELAYSYVYPTRVEWHAVSGDLARLDGRYDLEDRGRVTHVRYSLTVEPRFPLPGFLRRTAEAQIMDTALRALKRRAEGIAHRNAPDQESAPA